MSVIDDARIVLRWDKNNFNSILEELDVDKNKPIKDMDKSILNLLFYGVIDKDFEKKRKNRKLVRIQK